MWRISADTGGTFTDCHAWTAEGDERRCKVLSTSCLRSRVIAACGTELTVAEDWSVPDGFLTGFQLQLPNGERQTIAGWTASTKTLRLDAPVRLSVGDIVELTTGEEAPILGARMLTGTAPGKAFPPLQLRVATTRATNALLERKGSRVALFITRGFGDLPEIGDQRRASLFALRHSPRPKFHEASIEVPGRLGPKGDELEPLDLAPVREAALACLQSGIRHAAVALLHSHANPAHEQAVEKLLRELGFEHVSISSALARFVKLLPRTQSAIANAYLTGPAQGFISGVAAPLAGSEATVHIMTSAGGLETMDAAQPKDLLLSGPAGGALGAARSAAELGFTRVLTLDMGGTSTDVARLEDGRPGYRFTQHIEGMSLLAPCVAIETVAAGGGSICQWTASGLQVGPQSAGSHPGPACYGKGGPLTITDVNLLLGRFDPARAPIPLDATAAEQRLAELREQMLAETGAAPQRETLLLGLLDIACEHMADAIRRISVAEGYAPAEYALLAFGGAGPQHACAVAHKLGITTILIPRNAGILSAVGLQHAVRERFVERQVLRPLDEVAPTLQPLVQELVDEGKRLLGTENAESDVLAELRLRGQDTPLQVRTQDISKLGSLYAQTYERLFGYAPPANRVIELVSLRVSVREQLAPSVPVAASTGSVDVSSDELRVVQDAFSTLVIEPGWSAKQHGELGWILRRETSSASASPSALQGELFRHRVHSIVDDMGALLKRTAISTNIRERLDYSCALLDAKGRLVASAPHIPVHLGALGVCVRLAVAECGELKHGDTLITNHPGYGGSHLPDVTLITAVWDEADELIGYVANRAHHAEIGGRTPGSMPADAVSLAEEGVVFKPQFLVEDGTVLMDDVASQFTNAKFPTRNLADNLADLHAQLAANRYGLDRLRELGDAAEIRLRMADILDHSAKVMRRRLSQVREAGAQEMLDDGSLICVALRHSSAGQLIIDFTGTSATHPRNLNATRAIVNSVVLYVLRVLLQEDLPLNEGLLEPVELVLPEVTLLNPNFTGDPERDPAVVGGNVEVSQRLVDTLFKALGLQACSQGTMNNLLFGNAQFGYYETIAGGAGAGPDHDGASAIHTHMTNTAITDPEVMELRYPVRLRQFAIRRGSGGGGTHRGGDGVVREIEFLEPLTISLLTQHRVQAPYGLGKGAPGLCGRQTLLHQDGAKEPLPPAASFAVSAGDRLLLETPGGGGWA